MNLLTQIRIFKNAPCHLFQTIKEEIPVLADDKCLKAKRRFLMTHYVGKGGMGAVYKPASKYIRKQAFTHPEER